MCIAVLPLIKAEWWEEHQPHAVIFWSLLFIVPFALSFSVGTALETVLECIVNDYLTFIILLFGLFCVSGNITMSGDLAGSPKMCIRDRDYFFAPNRLDKAILFEIFTNSQDESDALKVMNTLESSPRGVAKKAIKGMLGDQMCIRDRLWACLF